MLLLFKFDLINQKTGGSTKYINKRDKDFIGAYLQEENYRREFTDALRDYVDMGNTKYAIFTDMIYQSIFKEKSREYREILKLQTKDKIRDTLYSEVLDLVASYECGLAAMIKEQSDSVGHKLNNWEVNDIFHAFELLPHWKPLIFRARTKMASRDVCFRDALHHRLEEYIKAVPSDDFEKFLDKTSKSLAEQVEETRDVFQRLKDR